jgi:hypothetical protein
MIKNKNKIIMINKEMDIIMLRMILDYLLEWSRAFLLLRINKTLKY